MTRPEDIGDIQYEAKRDLAAERAQAPPCFWQDGPGER